MKVKSKELRHRRLELNKTLNDVCQETGKQMSCMSKMENGKRMIDTINGVIKILEAYGYKVEDAMEVDDKPLTE